MQILPTTKQEAAGDHLFAALHKSTEEGSSSFADELMRHHSAQQSVDKGENFSVSSALAADPQANAPLTQAPYSRNTTDGVTYSMEEVSFTKVELQELRQKLEKAGAPPEALENLNKLAQQPDGATLAQVLASLQQATTPPTLSESDINTLKSLCERIDSTGILGSNVLNMVGEGKGKQALALITQSMNALPADARITLDKSEMAVLSRALGLSATTQNVLQKSFGPYNSLTLDAATFSKFMGPATHEFVERDSMKAKLEKALDATLTPILKKAKERMAAEKAASELSSRRTEQSKTLIEKTMLRNVNATLENAQAAQSEQANGTQPSLRDALAGRAGQQDDKNINPLADRQADKTGTLQDKLNATEQGKPNAAGAQANASAVPATSANGKEVFSGEDGKQGKDAKNDKKNDGWEALLGKTEVRGAAAPTTATATASPLVGMAGAVNATGVGASSALENLAATKGGNERSVMSRQAASQVEQAMLSAMRDGTKRLELQLHPGELGNLTLMLTMRNGEVSATIRSEKGETADMLNRQLDALRVSLEQQGVKVDKLEVQTQLADSNSRQQWEGMQQHNSRQEEYARRDTLDRLRNLGRSRNSSEISTDIALEQGVQLDMRTAGNAAQSIYIVA